MNDELKLFTDNQKDFLKFLKAKYHLYHLSNVFFRDMHYGVMAYLQINNMSSKYTSAEELTRKVVGLLEKANILKNVDHLAWVLHYPEFKKPSAKPAPPAKLAASPAKPAGAATAPKPATPAAASATKPAGTPPPASTAGATREVSQS